MNTRKLFALFLVLALTGSALAMQQQRLYKSDGGDPEAEGVIAVQQHSVFVEIIVQEEEEVRQIHQFAAVVGLVKKCKQVRNVFDNAVLWFNDQFLFGNKSNQTVNVTPTNDTRFEFNNTNHTVSMGYNPNRTFNTTVDDNGSVVITDPDVHDQNRIGGSYTYNPATQMPESNGDETANVTNAGGNPDRDGFVRANLDKYGELRERWGGCYIPNGFVHAIGSDDPYATGVVTDNIGLTKDLIDLDHDCDGCLFDYIGTFYITDPNNHRWMIDKYTYPLDLADTLGFAGMPGQSDGPGSDDPTNCHVGNAFMTGQACGDDAEIHSDRQEDDGVADNEVFDDGECGPERPPGANQDPEDGVPDECADGNSDDEGTHNFNNTSANEPDNAQSGETSNGNENVDNHCYDGDDGECTAHESDPTDPRHKGCEIDGHDTIGESDGDNLVECAQYPSKVTSKEPMYTVHIQVDPWNPYRQGFPDEAIWAYEDGTRRLGAPYADDADKHELYEECKSGTVDDENLHFDPDDQMGSTDDPKEPVRGTAGTHVECAIEYNFLIAVDFEAFDDVHPSGDAQDLGGSPTVPTGEGEIIREGKEYGEGGADSDDKWWQGNSGPHNPYKCWARYANDTSVHEEPNHTHENEHNWDEDGLTGEDHTHYCDRSQPSDPEPKERLDVLALDLFFYRIAPTFTMDNPYWNWVNGDPGETTGTPPIVDSHCQTAIAEAAPHQVDAVAARTPIVCDVDAMDGFRLHDGAQTLPYDEEGGQMD